MFFAGAWKQLRWSSDCGQRPKDCPRRTDQHWQKPGGRTCWVDDVVCAVDFAQRNGDVSDWTVQDTVNAEVLRWPAVQPGIDGPWPPAWTLFGLGRGADGASCHRRFRRRSYVCNSYSVRQGRPSPQHPWRNLSSLPHSASVSSPFLTGSVGITPGKFRN